MGISWKYHGMPCCDTEVFNAAKMCKMMGLGVFGTSHSISSVSFFCSGGRYPLVN